MKPWNPLTTPDFTVEELSCKCGNCGGVHDMDQDFMEKLQAIRDEVGRPLTITSGYRCPMHPEEAKKQVPGAHGAGLAADIKVRSGTERFELIYLGVKYGMVGIGVANSFVHLDAGHPVGPRPAAWKY